MSAEMNVGADDLLVHGELTVIGRIMPASNATFLCRLGPEEAGVRAVYKPVSGERPLWDFADGTLADREYAAWVVSDALGWDVVPPTCCATAAPGRAWCSCGASPTRSRRRSTCFPTDRCRPAACTCSTRSTWTTAP